MLIPVRCALQIAGPEISSLLDIYFLISIQPSPSNYLPRFLCGSEFKPLLDSSLLSSWSQDDTHQLPAALPLPTTHRRAIMSNLDAFIDPTLSAQSSQTMATHTSTHDHGPAAGGSNIAGAGASTGATDDADDPIVASINILIKPTLPAHRRVLVLEHPTRSDGSKPARAPLELRTKPATGMVELDFPVDFGTGYDKDKGKAWGAHLAKSTEAKKGGSHGLAGGFGVGAPPPRAARGGAASAADHVDPSMMDWNEALRRDLVLRTQTLGGQMPDAGAESKYMVGVFAGST